MVDPHLVELIGRDDSRLVHPRSAYSGGMTPALFDSIIRIRGLERHSDLAKVSMAEAFRFAFRFIVLFIYFSPRRLNRVEEISIGSAPALRGGGGRNGRCLARGSLLQLPIVSITDIGAPAARPPRMLRLANQRRYFRDSENEDKECREPLPAKIRREIRCAAAASFAIRV